MADIVNLIIAYSFFFSFNKYTGLISEKKKKKKENSTGIKRSERIKIDKEEKK